MLLIFKKIYRYYEAGFYRSFLVKKIRKKYYHNLIPAQLIKYKHDPNVLHISLPPGYSDQLTNMEISAG